MNFFLVQCKFVIIFPARVLMGESFDIKEAVHLPSILGILLLFHQLRSTATWGRKTSRRVTAGRGHQVLNKHRTHWLQCFLAGSAQRTWVPCPSMCVVWFPNPLPSQIGTLSNQNVADIITVPQRPFQRTIIMCKRHQVPNKQRGLTDCSAYLQVRLRGVPCLLMWIYFCINLFLKGHFDEL